MEILDESSAIRKLAINGLVGTKNDIAVGPPSRNGV